MVNLHEQDLTRVVSLVSQSLLVVPELIQHYLSWCCDQRLFPTGYACGRSHGFGQQVRNADFSYVRLTYAIFWMFSRCSRSVCYISSRKTLLLDDFDCWSIICHPPIGIHVSIIGACMDLQETLALKKCWQESFILTALVHPLHVSTKSQSGQHCKAANTVMFIHVHPFSYPPRQKACLLGMVQVASCCQDVGTSKGLFQLPWWGGLLWWGKHGGMGRTCWGNTSLLAEIPLKLCRWRWFEILFARKNLGILVVVWLDFLKNNSISSYCIISHGKGNWSFLLDDGNDFDVGHKRTHGNITELEELVGAQSNLQPIRRFS